MVVLDAQLSQCYRYGRATKFQQYASGTSYGKIPGSWYQWQVESTCMRIAGLIKRVLDIRPYPSNFVRREDVKMRGQYAVLSSRQYPSAD